MRVTGAPTIAWPFEVEAGDDPFVGLPSADTVGVRALLEAVDVNSERFMAVVEELIA